MVCILVLFARSVLGTVARMHSVCIIVLLTRCLITFVNLTGVCYVRVCVCVCGRSGMMCLCNYVITADGDGDDLLSDARLQLTNK